MKNSKKVVSTKPSKPWTPEDLSRITSSLTKKTGGIIPKGSWVSEVQSKVDKQKNK